MKAALRKALEFALEFLGAEPRPSPGRVNKELRSAPASSCQHSSHASSVSVSGTWYPGAEIRQGTEVDRYVQVADMLDPRVLADRGWLKCLAGIDAWQTLAKLEHQDLLGAEQNGRALSYKLFDLVSHFAADFGTLTRQAISMTPPAEVSERRKVSKPMSSVETTESIIYIRWRASTASWSLSCREKNGVIEFFLVPASDLMALSQAEAPLRLKLKLELMKVGGRQVWTCDGLPVSADDVRVLVRIIFRDLVSATQDQEQPVQSSSLGNVDDARLARSIEQLLLERQSLAHKVVIQQEEIQKRIARDLHDAVISDVMALKRNISSVKRISPEEALASLEVIVRKLREICYDLSPRDLSDWGLATVVEDMLDQIAQRTGIDCALNCDIEIPMMPAAVLLHIYRIIQESLNNAEKYAEPTRMIVTLEMTGSIFAVIVADNGKGFEPEAGSEPTGRSGGYGMGSLKERADLIRCFYPTKFWIKSAPGTGTRVRLEIDLAHFL